MPPVPKLRQRQSVALHFTLGLDCCFNSPIHHAGGRERTAQPVSKEETQHQKPGNRLEDVETFHDPGHKDAS